ncbi:uncharacterized protein BO95DRAFT_445345 [Aspergillus brunneoviolaceus CBS 621.78]|uniref:Uncharacterized protein n=1 Tax=Aspergillus brunneoviolaceus CBS 621.78 TaxID=1450534 RepID=A0ACD1G1M6_9EURO|nr:hypothetical protein BO95DRAFT_445345 [Aspergillus brunneoviolaceus CBS 621.78]RAH43168.1 hypothetical protein BO95DRAFT_445345 [Aspergillus brunneoviolaceus CBS 621.78]
MGEIPGADLYYLKSILHNWNDEAARVRGGSGELLVRVAVWPGEGADPQCVIESCLVESEA